MEKSARQPRLYTVQEYLTLEDAAEDRHEYRDGRIIAMAGASTNHNRIVRNLAWRLAERLQRTKCENLGENQRIRVDRGLYCYADQLVVCRPLIYDPPDRTSNLVNPVVVFEVESESTSANDRTEKFDRYIGIESLREYVLISQEKAWVQTFYRHAEGVWAFGGIVRGLDGRLRLRSCDFDLPLEQIYDGVELTPPPTQ